MTTQRAPPGPTATDNGEDSLNLCSHAPISVEPLQSVVASINDPDRPAWPGRQVPRTRQFPAAIPRRPQSCRLGLRPGREPLRGCPVASQRRCVRGIVDRNPLDLRRILDDLLHDDGGGGAAGCGAAPSNADTNKEADVRESRGDHPVHTHPRSDHVLSLMTSATAQSVTADERPAFEGHVLPWCHAVPRPSLLTVRQRSHAKAPICTMPGRPVSPHY